jgi:hypothetical protein
MLCTIDTYKQVYHQQIAQLQNIKAHPLRHKVMVRSRYKETIYRIYHLIKEDEISQFQDVWIQKILIIVMCYNNFNNSNITLHIDMI